MKLEVEVLRAEQSWDLKSGVQQNYLVIEVLGLETRVPCTEEELTQVLREIGQAQLEQPQPQPELDEAQSVQAPPVFQSAPETMPEQPRLAVAPSRRLAPVQRPRGDDVGIAQG